ncbi:MAG: DUF6605 domain-containing protein [Vicinamibacterales bacterium]
MLASIFVIWGVIAALPTGIPTRASGVCDADPESVACENTHPGNPASDWETRDEADGSPARIVGFASDISVPRGGVVHFKVETDATSYAIDIYRMGFYGGAGARRIAGIRPTVVLPQVQPTCLVDEGTGLVDCGNWRESASWRVPDEAISGIYIARLMRPDTGAASHIVFVVRDDVRRSDVLMQTADTTWQAYNDYGGASLAGGGAARRASRASYDRPFATRRTSPSNWLFGAEYPMVRWLEANGYDVTYAAGADTDRRGALLANHRVFLSAGHDAYWTAAQRANVEAARAAGVHLGFFGGNIATWKTRWAAGLASDAGAYRTLVLDRDRSPALAPGTPTTGAWRDPKVADRPESALTGELGRLTGGQSDPLVVSAAEGRLRFWRHTSVAALGPGETTSFPLGYLGGEWDTDGPSRSRPAGLVRLSTTTVAKSTAVVLQDDGESFAPGRATHHLSLYRDASGALVFGAGTSHWSWGLDASHDALGTAAPPDDLRIQQATVNLLADMGVRPSTPQAGVVPSPTSADALPPSSAVTSPNADVALTAGEAVTISGTAVDNGGGVVAGVEVSTDGGRTWEAASGRERWSYVWTPADRGTATVSTRAVDDSGRLETPSASRTWTVATATAAASSRLEQVDTAQEPTASAVAPLAPSGVLLAAYNMDEGAGTILNDRSGFATHGTLTNGPVWTPGKYGQALRFDGLDDFVAMPASAALDVSGTALTIEFWANVLTGGATPDYAIVDKPWTTGQMVSPWYQYGVEYDGGSGSFTFYIGTPAGVRAFGMAASTAAWHHVAFTYDGAQVRGYLDGVLKFTTPETTPLTARGTGLRLGVDAIGGQGYKGQLDDLRIYSRSLTQAEVQADMATPVVSGPAPTVTGFTPTSGASATAITVTGTGFTGATLVRFGSGDQTTFTVVNDTTVTTTVPGGATTGPIQVVTPAGTATSAASFSVVAPAPTIASFTPTSGPPGTPITVVGTNFTGATLVRVATASQPSFTVVDSATISTSIPPDATTGVVQVVTPAGTATSVQAFTVTAAPPSDFPLRPSANGRYLVDRNDRPFLIVGDSPHALIGKLDTVHGTASGGIDLAGVNAYFASRRAAGVNAVWAEMFCSAYGLCGGFVGPDGVPPFTATLPGGAFDLATPNENYFAKVDAVVSAAAQNGIVVFLDPTETGGWMDVFLANGIARASAFGAYLGTRYRNSPNLVWQHGNDFQTWATAADRAVIQAVASGIASADPNHVQTVELDFPSSGSLNDASWAPFIALDSAYSYTSPYDQVLSEYNRANHKPVYFIEGVYEFQSYQGGYRGPQSLRAQEYWTQLSGSAGQLYGNAALYAFPWDWRTAIYADGTTWDTTVGLRELRYMADFFRSRRWYDLVPDQDPNVTIAPSQPSYHTVVTAGFGAFQTLADPTLGNVSTYVTSARTPDGQLIVSYIPDTTVTGAITVDMGALAGPANARWFDPTSGTYTTVAGSPFANTGSRQFARAQANGAGDHDWVLVLEVATASGAILSPAHNSHFRAGEHIVMTGNGTDGQGAALPDSAFSWSVVLRHDGHVHPAIGPVTGTRSLAFDVPTSGHDFSGATQYDIVLTVTDAGGLTSASSVTILPDKVNLAIDTVPSGLAIQIDGASRTAPFVYDTLKGFEHTLVAPPQTLAGHEYQFASWSDGGAASHVVTVPDQAASFVASFTDLGGSGGGLVAAWGANEGAGTTLVDNSGHGHTGLVTNGTWTAGRFGQALAFAGSSDASLGDIDVTASFTLMAWMKTHSLYAGSCGALVMKAFDYGLEICSGQLSARLGSGSAWSSAASAVVSNSDLDVWTHVAMTYDGVTLRLYLNGTLVSSTTGSHATNDMPLMIGRWSPPSEYWSGAVDEVRLYDRFLTAAEIQADMNTPVDPTAPDPPTVTGFTPASGAVGATVTLSGTNFTGATLVRFNTTDQPTFTVVNATTIAAAVPAGATTGPIQVVTPGGTATSASSFTVTAVTATPSSVTVLTGAAAGGSVASLLSNDNVFFSVSSTTTGNRTAGWYAAFASVPRTLTRLTVNYSGNNSRNCTQSIAIWNWRTSVWVPLDSRTVGTTEIAIGGLVPSGALGDYVSGSAGVGEVRVRIQSQANQTFTSRGDVVTIVY